MITIYDIFLALIILSMGTGLWYMLGRIAFLCLQEAVYINKMKLINKQCFEYNEYEYSTIIHSLGPLSFAIIITIYLSGYIREIFSNIMPSIARFCYKLIYEIKQRIYKYQEKHKNRWDE